MPCEGITYFGARSTTVTANFSYLLSLLSMHAVRCTDGDLRLAGGSSATEGRVEICIDETWGTICDDMWSSVDAQVACRDLGFSYIGTQTV